MRGAAAARALAALALAAGVAGCDAQADREYPGEPLFTLHGQVTGTPPLPPLEAAMIWQLGSPPAMSDQVLATRVPVEATFPATFTIRLLQPPPAAARLTLLPGEVPFARGNAAAVPLGTVATQVENLPNVPQAYSTSYGVDVDHWVIHLEADVPPGSLTEWWLGGVLPAGYHLVRVTPVNPWCMTTTDLGACVTELRERGVPDDLTAQAFCLASYRLSPAPDDEMVVLYLGTLLMASTNCP